MELKKWDAAEYLDTPEAQQEYLLAAMEENDPARLCEALGTIARARGMTDIAEATGLNRQALYKAFSSEGDPRASTLWKMLDALGIKLVPKIEKAS